MWEPKELDIKNKNHSKLELSNPILDIRFEHLMTSHTESFGIVLIEAMSYGIPCLAYTSAQGANEIIKDNETGYLIEDRNEEEMINKICSLIDDEKLRKQLGKNAREESKNYSSEVILEKWSKLINKRK